MCYFFVPIFTKGVVVLDYIIRNKSGLYVKLNKNGTPETCNESEKDFFECSKANNICNSLPKQLKKCNFFVEAVPEIQSKIEEQNAITTNTYEPSDNVTRLQRRVTSVSFKSIPILAASRGERPV